MITLLKRYFLVGALVIGALAALICIAILVFEPFTDSLALGCVLGLTVGYSLFLMCVAYIALDRPIWRAFAVAGIFLAFIGMIVSSGCEFYEITVGDWTFIEEHHLGQWTFSCLATATLFCICPAIGSLRMKSAGIMLRWVAMACLLMTYLLLNTIVWRRHDDPFADKTAAVFGFIAGATTLGVFVLYKFFGLKLPDPLTTFDQKLFVRCPRCLREQELPMGESQCSGCKLRFMIQMEEPRCPACGYSLRGLTSPQCPECGRMISQAPSAAIPA